LNILAIFFQKAEIASVKENARRNRKFKRHLVNLI